MTQRRYLILAPGVFADNAKTAHGVIAYGTDEIAAVLDPDHAGKRVRDVVPYLDSDAPIVGTIAEGLRLHPTSVLVGTAPKGGALPTSWRSDILAAIDAKLEIVSGLHEMLGDDPELSAAAERGGATIWDVRAVPGVPLFTGAVYDVKPPVLLAVGNDCAVGKMTVALELCRAAAARGQRAAFVPTGQTGVMIAGWGLSVDRVIADFATGACERLVLQAAQGDPDSIVVEGQGAINHPAYAPVTLSLLYGCAPDALLLVCRQPHERIETFNTPVLGYRALIDVHEGLCATVKPAKVVGIALNTRGLDDGAALAEIERARSETGLPADDIVRFGPHALYDAVFPNLRKHRPLLEVSR
ncbi:MAG TPA: DUF1611 domain-containing protein [Candidatus Baltobacteraceae bacterium]